MSETNGRKREKKSYRLYTERWPVDIERDIGTVEECYLQELSGAERDHWVNTSIARSKVDPNTGQRTGYDVRDLEALLVQKCLHKPDGSLFTLEEVKNFPSSQLTGLYRECEDLNGLSRRAAEAVKND